MVLSPITHQPAEFIKHIPVDLIIRKYKEEADVNVADYFKGLKEISVYKCKQTGYRFYYPLNLAGDDKLYEELQKFDWYYLPWKWDYTVADTLVSNGQKVLDIGCGYGDFLKHLKEKKQCDCYGLEFNDKAMAVATERGIKIRKEFVQDHAKTHAGQYDVVSYFHLLEHIADIDSFVKASIECLKPGGTLIICVPNNNPFWYQFDEYHSLNMPPHHMGLWDEESLSKLADIYPMRVSSISQETLKRYRYYTRLHINRVSKESGMKGSILKLLSPAVTGYFLMNRNNIKAGAILAAYKKNG